MLLYGETESGGKPDLGHCEGISKKYQIDKSFIFLDNTTAAWDTTFKYIETYGSGIGLPWNCLLRGSNMEYMWSSSVGTGEGIWAELDKLLAEEAAAP
jgi:hypothetical protein